MKYLLAILFFGTPKPEGCEDLKADCDGCKDYACTNNPSHNQVKGE